MTNYQTITVTILAVVIAGLIIYDVWVWFKTRKDPKGDATISKLLLNAAKKYPIVAVVFGAAIGVLAGHLWWPQHVYHVCP